MKLKSVIPVVGIALATLSCTTISEDLPESRSQSPTRPAPIVVVPVPVPSATPIPDPVPSPTPRPGSTPNPNPNPNPTPGAQGCSLPAGTGSGANCPFTRASFAEDVETAIDNVIRNNPGLFDMRDNRCVMGLGCPRILNPDAYWTAVTNEMRRMGYCAVNDGEELAVKNTNSWNDQYDVISGEGYPRRAPGSYRSTCFPAWF